MTRLYLAGPEVFHPDALALGAAKKLACAGRGFEGLYPLDGAAPGATPPDAMAIYARCVALMHEADAGIFNLTPFRGPSADVGTVLELGVMATLGKPVFAYTHAAADLIDRLRAEPGLALDAGTGLWRDPDGMSAEDFGLSDNLMLDGTLARQEGASLRRAGARALHAARRVPRPPRGGARRSRGPPERKSLMPTIPRMHSYEPSKGHGLAHDPFNAIVAPRPIGWISSRDAEGRLNLAPYSFFNAFLYTPPIVGFSSVGWKDSVANAEATREFVWNLVTRDIDEAMNVTSAPLAHGVSEFEAAGLTPVDSKIVGVPRVGEAHAAMECKVVDIIRHKSAAGVPADGWLVLGEVVAVHVDEALIVDGVYQTGLARPVLRAGRSGDYFEISDDAKFVMERPKGAPRPA